MSTEEHRERLIAFLNTVAKPGQVVGEAGDDESNLVQANVVDSFAVIQIIFYLEENYGVDLPAMGIDPADLVSIAGMMSVIERSFE